jgi:cbb3-type cytochrome oxidase subunit 3
VTALWAETAAFYSLAVVSVVGMLLCSIGSLAHAFHCRNKARARPPED